MITPGAKSRRELAERPELFARWIEETHALVAARLEVACWLGIVLVPVFIALDFVLHPQLVRQFIPIRIAMVSVNASALLLLRTTTGRRFVTPLSLLTFLGLGAGLVVMCAFNGGGSSPYYAGLNLVMLAGGVIMPWEPALSAACCALLIVEYAVMCVLWGGIPDVRVFTGNLFFLWSTATITVVSHVVGTELRRRELLQRSALEEAGRHREQFLANVGHELRTPLTAIFGYSEMLTDFMSDASPDVLGWLGRIHENAVALYRLVGQLLDFSNLETGELRVTREPVRLDTIVDKVADQIRTVLTAPAVEVACGMPEPTAVGDSARVEEILTQLASNALKFSNGQLVRMRVGAAALYGEPAWDRVVPEPGPDARGQAYLEIAVDDRGGGIRREELRRLFVAFQQLDGSSSRRHEGTGIGLALSARLAAAMRGHIAVRSTPGVGSTFALLLPAA